MWHYHPEILAKPVPRYTSYPTAMEFHTGVGADDHARALHDLPSGSPLSLYVHIPYCQSICWYCGCNTGAAGKAQRLTAYLEALEKEIALVGRMLGGRGKVQRIAFGGGSPNAIAPIEFVRLVDRITTIFESAQPDISVELDPCGFTAEWALVLAVSGVTRVSLGVQTLAPHVQAAIGRVQPLADVETALAALRMRGITQINFDLMYGLPEQSLDDLDETLDAVIQMRPSRISLFGYAHLPAMIPRQKRIDSASLPDARLRFEQSALGYERLCKAGYIPIGFDHFALPDDSLAIAAKKACVRRNFQGFTEDGNDILLGFGASAISHLPNLIVQNEKNVGTYRNLVNADRLAASRGIHTDNASRQRALIIEQILCQGRVDLDAQFLTDDVRARLDDFESKGLARLEDTRLTITPNGRVYARHIASIFDAFRSDGAHRPSS